MMETNWKDSKMRESGFYYLFQHFKRFYLPHIFPLWDPVDRLFVKNDGTSSYCALLLNPDNIKKDLYEINYVCVV